MTMHWFIVSLLVESCSECWYTIVRWYALIFAQFVCFKQKTAYEMRISDWSSDVCSSDLLPRRTHTGFVRRSASPWPSSAGSDRRVPGSATDGEQRDLRERDQQGDDDEFHDHERDTASKNIIEFDAR